MTEKYIGMNKPTENLKDQAKVIFEEIKKMEEVGNTERVEKLRENYRMISQKIRDLKDYSLDK